MADGGYRPKNGASEAPVHRARGDGVSLGDDFPILCETCLGQNPYVRMVKLPYGQKLCKISSVPYQSFRWKAGPQGRYKETIICHAVAVQRNICQTCLNDMKYGLPVGVRDALLEREESQLLKLPSSDVGNRYFYEQQSTLALENGTAPADFALDLANLNASRQLQTFARTINSNAPKHGDNTSASSGVSAVDLASSYVKPVTAFRNLPKLCSFWLNGACNRVAKKTCPFRPCCGSFAFPEIAGSDKEACTKLVSDLTQLGPAVVMKNLDPTVRAAIQAALRGNRDDAIRQRVSGDDSLTKKYLNRMKAMQLDLPPPDDPTITTLWLGNLDTEHLTDSYLKELLYGYGHIVAVHIVNGGNCAFVEFASREIAENAAKSMHNALFINGRQVNVNWAKPKPQGASTSVAVDQSTTIAMPAPPGLEHAPASSYSLKDMATPSLPPPPLPPGPPPSHGSSAKRKLGDSNEPGAVVAGVSKQLRAAHSASYPSMNPSRLGAC